MCVHKQVNPKASCAQILQHILLVGTSSVGTTSDPSECGQPPKRPVECIAGFTDTHELLVHMQLTEFSPSRQVHA